MTYLAAGREADIRRWRPLWWQRLLPTLLGAAVAAFIMSSVYVAWIRQPIFQPITFTEQQVARVLDTGLVEVPDVLGVSPSVRSDETVPVVGSVCNDHDQPVEVSGTVVWQRLTPRGFRVEAGKGVQEIPVGCSPIAFENTIPAGVADEVASAAAPELWEITGVVQISGGGTTTWRTESFWIAP